MWWRSPVAAAMLLAAAISLAGCGFQPLYGTTAGGSRLGAVMAGVEVTPIPGRVGQRVRNELIFENTGGGGRPDKSPYKLDIVIKETLINELVQITGDAKGQVYELDATFKLINTTTNRVLLEGRATSRAAFERSETIFSNVRARYDAEDRAASTVAESIKVRLAAFLSQAA
jgi:LPS-assembly lipoprotein